MPNFFDPHFAFSGILDGVDLSMVHFYACLLGALMALYVGRLWSGGWIPLLTADCWFAKFIGSAALCVVSLAMLWSLAYSRTKGWQPWPPDLAALIGVDLLLFATIILASKHRHHRHPVPG